MVNCTGLQPPFLRLSTPNLFSLFWAHLFSSSSQTVCNVPCFSSFSSSSSSAPQSKMNFVFHFFPIHTQKMMKEKQMKTIFFLSISFPLSLFIDRFETIFFGHLVYLSLLLHYDSPLIHICVLKGDFWHCCVLSCIIKSCHDFSVICTAFLVFSAVFFTIFLVKMIGCFVVSGKCMRVCPFRFVFLRKED